MFGLLLVTLATFLEESSDSFGKFEIRKKEESIFGMGFLSIIMGFLFLCVSLFFGQKFSFSSASLPTFCVRIILEILQLHIGLIAIVKADRSTYSFLRVITIPLLVMVDVFLMGYALKTSQLLGVLIIVITMVVSGYKNVLNKNGIWLALFTAVNAVFTISLYKYDISNFNSVVAEQGIITIVLLAYLMAFAHIRREINPFKLLLVPKFFLQSSSVGVGSLMETFAYMYAPASIIATGKRATAMLWSTLAGWKYFGEKNLLHKLVVCCFLVIGVFLLL